MKTYAELMKQVKDGIQAAEIPSADVITKAVIGVEDGSVDPSYVQEATSQIEAIATEAFDDVEGLTEAQISAAKAGLLLDQDPQTAIMTQRRDVKPASGTVVSVEAGVFGESDVASTAVVATEAFDGQIVSNNTPYSFATNLVMAKQDEFTETIYPTVVLQPGVSGCAVTTTIEKIKGDFLRSDATPDRKKAKDISIVKAMIDADSVLSGEKTRLVPVSNTTNADVLLTAFAYQTTVTGEAITTAPIKVDVDAPLLGISQTAAQLAQGVMDRTDAMDDTVVTERLYYEITDGTDTSSHFFDVSGFSSARWTPTATGNSKDIALSFVSDNLVINTTTTKQVDGTNSAVLDNLNIPDHKIVIRGIVYGSGNTAIGDITVSQGKFELVSIIDANGDLVDPTSAIYATVKDIIANLTLKGYTVEAYATNSNLRNIGYVIGAEDITTIYSVAYRTPISVIKPLVHAADIDNDANKVKTFGSQARAISMVLGINKLINYAGFLRSAFVTGTDVTLSELAGPARDLVNPFYENRTIELDKTVDSLNSKDIADNIRGALEAVISETVTRMMTETGFVDALENSAVAPGAKPTIIIATDRKIKNILTRGNEPLKLSDSVNVKIVATGSKLFTDKIMVMPTAGVGGLNPLNFGVRAFVPTPTVEVKRTINGATVNALFNQPAFAHINLLPILAEFDVTGFQAVTAKIPQYTKTV